MRAATDDIVLFAGPTLAGSPRARVVLRGVRVRPPVKRGDVADLVARRAPCVIAICDGVFHDTLAVGHAEIRDALRRGFRVWGLSSMGAIRAREMQPLGMRGFGNVFARFMADGDFQDDEVALLHEPGPSYRAVSEPLVHLRAAIDHLVAHGHVSARAARSVVLALKGRWYGERTLRQTRELLAPNVSPARLREVFHDFHPFALKTLDLERFLMERPWKLERGGIANGSETALEEGHDQYRRRGVGEALRGGERALRARPGHGNRGRRPRDAKAPQEGGEEA
jgi:hypothetical protein